MPAAQLSDEVLREAVEAVKANGTVVAAAAALGMSRGTLEHRLRAARLRGIEPGVIVQPAPSGHRVKGTSTLYDAKTGEAISQWVKTTQDGPSFEEMADAMRAALEDYRASYSAIDAPTEAEDSLTVYPLVDWHVGLLAWAEETGENYDLAIARDTILRVQQRLIAASPPSRMGIVLGLGDLLHFDGYEPVTARSRNFLDADGRYPKVLKTATQMVIATIDMALARHEQVLVRILPGNHDDQSAVAVSLALDMRYADHPRVVVDTSPSRFWWFRFGKVFLGGVHGDKAKMKDLPLVMAHDRPHDWAASSYRRIYSGHLHHERRIEEGGVIVTCMRSPVAKDAYHSFERYRAGRSVYSETFRADGTEAATLSFNL